MIAHALISLAATVVIMVLTLEPWNWNREDPLEDFRVLARDSFAILVYFTAFLAVWVMVHFVLWLTLTASERWL